MMAERADVIHLNKDRICVLLAKTSPLPLNGCVIQMEAHMLASIFHSRLAPRNPCSTSLQTILLIFSILLSNPSQITYFWA